MSRLTAVRPKKFVRVVGASTLMMIAALGVTVPQAFGLLAITNTYYVGTTADDAGSVKATTCAAPTNTTCTLRDAVLTANADGSGIADTILFSHLHAPAVLTVNATYGSIAVNPQGSVTIRGAGAGATFLSGGHRTQVMTTNGNVTLANLTVENGFSNVDGGGLSNSGTLTLNGVNFLSNVANSVNGSNDGGGLYTSGALTVHGGVFNGNTATNCGGALEIATSVLTTLDKVSLTNNTSDCGGAVYTNSSSNVVVSRSTISGNYVRDYDNGGGLEVHGTLLLENDTIAHNTSTEYGGGIAVVNGNVTMVNVTVADNNALQAGGGIYSNSRNSQLSVQGSILQNNVVYDNVQNQCFGYGPVVSQGYNVVGAQGDTSCNFYAAGDKVDANAHLGALTNNGGPTATMALPLGSPAVLLVPKNLCPATDQRGVARSGMCDAGAYELTPTTSSVLCSSLTGSATGVITLSGCTPTSVGNKTATAAGALLTNGGKFTWHSIAKTTTVSLSSTSPGRGGCTSGHTEHDLKGTVVASQSSYTKYFDKVSARVCQSNSTNAVTLVPGTHFAL